MLSIKQYLLDLWLENKQADIFLVIYKYWPKPASTIASLAKTERSYTYKLLETWCKQWFVSQTIIWSTKNYYVLGSEVLIDLLNKRKNHIQDLEDKYDSLRDEFKLLDQAKIWYIPQFKIYDGANAINKRYEDIYMQIMNQWIINIQFCFTDLFVSQVESYKYISDLYIDFLQKLQSEKIHIESILWQWTLLVESYHHINYDKLSHISIWNQSIQMRIVGQSTFIGLFRDVPIAYQIQSSDTADLFASLLHHVNLKK